VINVLQILFQLLKETYHFVIVYKMDNQGQLYAKPTAVH